MSLSHSPADIIAQMLVDLNLGTNPTAGGAWPVYVSNEPDKPDNCITVYDTVGQGDGRFMVSGHSPEHYGFQVRVRATDHTTGYAKADAIKTALEETAYEETIHIGNSTYLVYSVSKATPVNVLGKQAGVSKRNLFTVNGLVVIGIIGVVSSTLLSGLGDYWSFNSTLNGVSGNNGSGSGSPGYQSGLLGGNALRLIPDSSQYVTVPHALAITPVSPGGFTMAVWFNLTNNDSDRNILAHWQADEARGFGLRWDQTTSVNGRLRFETADGTLVGSIFAAPVGSWCLAMFGYNATTQRLFMSINGAAETTQPVTNPTILYGSPADLIFGKYVVGVANMLDGLIGPAAIWPTRKLTTDEVAEFYNNGNANAYPFN